MELVKIVKDPSFPPHLFVCMLVSAWLCFIESGEPNVLWLCQALMAQCRGQRAVVGSLEPDASNGLIACGFQQAGVLQQHLMGQNVLVLSPGAPRS